MERTDQGESSLPDANEAVSVSVSASGLVPASTRGQVSIASSILFEVSRGIALHWCQPSLEMRHGVDRADQFAG